jgi:protein TonB
MSDISICPSRFSSDTGGFADDKSQFWLVVLIVLILHVILWFVWRMQPEEAKPRVMEMAVTFDMQQAAVVQPSSPPLPLPPPPLKPQPNVERVEKMVTRQVVEDAVEVMKTPVQTPAPFVPPVVAPVVAAPPAPLPAPVVETEPDYQADYLHNPRPTYPLIARRMRYHGKVLLDVEVLSSGNAGQVKLHRGSGYEVLDNSALEVVKSWHFTPAKRAGQAITRWFIVPINFTLEETQA